MNKPKLLGIVAFGGLAAIISCDSGTGGTAGRLDANDCPVGTFRPVGLTDCVFPSVDVNGLPIGVSDNRCAFGQPAVPPQCVSDSGARPYLTTSTSCATGYRYEPGACNRNDGTAGVATGFGTGFGTGSAGAFGAAGAAGSFEQGFGGDNGTAGVTVGEAGTSGTGAGAASGTGAAGSLLDGSGGTGATAGMSGQSASDASSGPPDGFLPP
jgi:hypothetical protein